MRAKPNKLRLGGIKLKIMQASDRLRNSSKAQKHWELNSDHTFGHHE